MFEFMLQYLSSDKIVEVSRTQHLPINLLHQTFTLAQSTARTNRERLEEIKGKF